MSIFKTTFLIILHRNKLSVINFRFRRARQYVECTFGLFNNKWGIFHTALNFSKNVVKACIVLYNKLRKRDGYRRENLIIPTKFTIENFHAEKQFDRTRQGVRSCFVNFFVTEGRQLPWQLSKI